MKKLLAFAALVILHQVWGAPALAGTMSEIDSMFKTAEGYDICEDFRSGSAIYLKIITKLRQTDPNSPKILRAQAKLARIYLLIKHFDEAEPIFHILIRTDQKKLSQDPELRIDFDSLSEAYTTFENTPRYNYEALKHCLTLRKYIDPSHPELPDTYYKLAEYCRQKGDHKESADWSLKGIAQDKTLPASKQGALVRDMTFLCETYVKTEQIDKAQQTAKDALKVVQRCSCGLVWVPALHCYLGHLATRKGQYDLADKELDLAVKAMPKTAEFSRDWSTLAARYRRENKMVREKSKRQN